MGENRPLYELTERIAASVDRKAVLPLIRFLGRSGRIIDTEDLNDLMMEIDLSPDQLELVSSVVGDYLLELSGKAAAGPPPPPGPPDAAADAEAESGEAEGPDPAPEAMDSIRFYMNEVSELKVLSLEEELQCGEQIARGRRAGELLEKAGVRDQGIPDDVLRELEGTVSAGERAKELLIERNLSTVIAIAKKHRSSGVSLGDLIQEGNIGLIRAAERYDYRKGYRFNTYASYWIRQGIQRGIANSSRTIRLPFNAIESGRKITGTSSLLTQELGREPTPAEIAEAMGTDERTVQAAIRSAEPVVSLDAPVQTDDASALPFRTFLPDTADHDPGPAAERNDLRRRLDHIMRGLTVREDCVIRLRFGMEDGCAHTLEEIGTELGLTRERVRQIEKGALNKLGTPEAKQAMESFLRS